MGRENKTIYVILGLLSHEPMTGYDLKKRIDLSLSYFWETGYGQIYPTLASLETKGWVASKAEEKGQKMEKLIYSITDEGRLALHEWLEVPAEIKVIKYEILLKLFFGSQLGAEKNIVNIQAFKDVYAAQLPMLERFEKELEAVLEQEEDHLYYLLTVKFGKKVYEAYAEWADEAMALLDQKKEKNHE